MARYIDADKLKEYVGKNPVFRVFIDAQPTADVAEVRHGKWLNVFIDGLGFNGLVFECSRCGKRSDGRTNYCAYCGAKMDGGSLNDGT